MILKKQKIPNSVLAGRRAAREADLLAPPTKADKLKTAYIRKPKHRKQALASWFKGELD